MIRKGLDRLAMFFVPLVGWMMIQLLGRTWRFSTLPQDDLEHLPQEGRPLIYALWHGRMLPLIYRYRGRPIYALVSQHRDGELAVRLVHRLGYQTVRGSSTRGGVKGSQELLRVLQGGSPVAIMPDGPRGPARKVQQGVIRLAQLSGCPIIPITVGISKSYALKSWDRFIIPRPFARCVIVYGRPILVPGEAPQQIIEEKRTELEDMLNQITAEAEAASL